MAFPIQLLILVFLFCVSAGVVDSDDGKSPLKNFKMSPRTLQKCFF